MAATHEPEEQSTRPSTNEQLGVLGRQAADAEPPRTPTPLVLSADERNSQALRERLIGLAQGAPVPNGDTLTPEAVVARATAYLEFVQGGTDGRAG